MLTPAQQKERLTGIGGSDVAAILGISPWKTPLQVYMEKRGELELGEENRFTKWGSILEPLIRQEYEEQTGHKVTLPDGVCRHPEHVFMLANLDGLTMSDPNDIATLKVVEIKTAMQFKASQWGAENTDELPDYYLTQVHHYMTVIDAHEADVAVLIGGNDFRIYNVKRDYEISQMLIERESEFWQMVLDGTPPSIETTEDWLLQYKQCADRSIDGAAKLTTLQQLRQKQLAIKSLEGEIDTLKIDLMRFIGDNKEVTINGTKVGGITVRNAIGWNLDALSLDANLVEKYKTKVNTSAFFQFSRTKNLDDVLKGI